MTREHLAVPESKEVLKKKKRSKNSISDKGTQKPNKNTPLAKGKKNFSNKIYSIALDYNLKYKVRIHDSPVINTGERIDKSSMQKNSK